MLMQVQVCAAGALLNIQCPLLETMSQVSASRDSLGRLVTSVLTLAIIERCIADAEGNLLSGLRMDGQ